MRPVLEPFPQLRATRCCRDLRRSDKPHWIVRAAVYLLLLAAATMVVLSLIGCHGPQLAAQIKSAQDRAALKQAQAAANPLAHPFAATSEAVTSSRKPLGFIAVVSLLALGAFVGLYFTPLSWVSTIGLPVDAGVCAASFGGYFFLPFFPWILAGGLVLVIGFVIYELATNPSARKKLEAELHLTSAPVPGSAQAPIVLPSPGT